MAILKVGIISQTLVQQHHLRHIVEECGYEVEVAWLINQLIDDLALLKNTEAIDVWLVDVDTFSLNQTKKALLFERWLFDLKTPVIFGEGNTYNATEEGFSSWIRQLTSKLLSVSGQLYLDQQQQQQQQAEFVWVLAASTGGPEAVKKFLDLLPAGLGIAFLYTQHIEARQNRSLATSVTRDSQYHGRVANHGDTLCADTVTIVPAKQELDVLSDGTLIVREQAWRGEYKPSIDQVVATVADRYGSRGGAIFFSGMGDDGVTGARLMARRAGRVWIQAPPTCASDSMPLAVSRTGCVTATGSPEQLSDYLMHAVRGLKETALIG
ncbi:MAG: chemotaxis protein CheB [Cellvibrionaceae bacterium]